MHVDRLPDNPTTRLAWSVYPTSGGGKGQGKEQGGVFCFVSYQCLFSAPSHTTGASYA